ncbi:MAG: TlpA disulfide reductase family protein [Methylophilaceae bacterium]
MIIIIGLVATGLGITFKKNYTLPETNKDTHTFFTTTLIDHNGNKVQLNQYRQSWLLVNFWATWCAPCRKEIPELNEFFHKNKNLNINLIGIAIDEIEPVNKFTHKVPIDYTSLISNIAGINLAKSLGNKRGVLPFTVLIDPDENIKKVFYGKVKINALNQTVNTLIQ